MLYNHKERQRRTRVADVSPSLQVCQGSAAVGPILWSDYCEGKWYAIRLMQCSSYALLQPLDAAMCFFTTYSSRFLS